MQQKLVDIVTSFKKTYSPKLEKAIVIMKKLYLPACIYMPLKIAESNLYVLVAEQKRYGEVDFTLLFATYLTSIAQICLCEYMIMSVCPSNKITKTISFILRSLAAIVFVQAMILFFA